MVAPNGFCRECRRLDLVLKQVQERLTQLQKDNARLERRCARLKKDNRRLRDELEQQRRDRSEEHTSELQSRVDLVCRLLLEKKKTGRTTPDDASEAPSPHD